MTILPMRLPNGFVAQVETLSRGGIEPVRRGEQDVAGRMPTFENVTGVVEGVATALAATFEKVRPRTASVEFELDFSVESGQLTALFVKGSGSGTLTVKLEWGTSDALASGGT
jgi:hypothetical protein